MYGEFMLHPLLDILLGDILSVVDIGKLLE
jgi:hypothetical protein